MQMRRARFSVAIVLGHLRASHRGNQYHYLTGRCPKGMPRGQWERVSIPKWPIMVSWLGAGIACAVFILVMLDIARTGLNPRTPTLFTMICAGVLFFVTTGVLSAIPRYRERRFERTVCALEYGVCFNCGYSLQGLPKEHNCPECGDPYNKEELRREWKTWFARERVAKKNKENTGQSRDPGTASR